MRERSDGLGSVALKPSHQPGDGWIVHRAEFRQSRLVDLEENEQSLGIQTLHGRRLAA